MLVGALVIGVSLVLGFVAFVVLGTIVTVLAAIIGIRLWWLNRKLVRGAGSGRPERRPASDQVIEGEFRVVDKGRRDEPSDGA